MFDSLVLGVLDGVSVGEIVLFALRFCGMTGANLGLFVALDGVDVATDGVAVAVDTVDSVDEDLVIGTVGDVLTDKALLLALLFPLLLAALANMADSLGPVDLSSVDIIAF